MNLLLFQFRGELRKLFARKRTWLGFLAFAAVELLMPLLLECAPVKQSFRALIAELGQPFDDYFSAPTIALIVTRATLFLIGSLYVALVAGDIVSKEVEDGTMRMLLSRPVTRLRIVAMKYLATIFYTTTLSVFIGLVSLGAAFLYEGRGGFFAFGWFEHVVTFLDFGTGLARYFAAIPMFVVSLLTVNATAFFLSCLNMKPAAATVATLTIFFIDYVFHSLPFFEPLEPWFISTRLSLWMRVFEHDIPWPTLLENITLLLTAGGTLFVLGWMSFERRDFKA